MVTVAVRKEGEGLQGLRTGEDGRLKKDIKRSFQFMSVFPHPALEEMPTTVPRLSPAQWHLRLPVHMQSSDH